MKYLIFFIFIILSCSSPKNDEKKLSLKNKRKADLSNPNNKLSGKTETLELEYILWGCACANWIESSKRAKYEANNQLGEKNNFYRAGE
ncbi:hypothetical protein [Chryseobacterium mulctrae]|uniref:hypothetical protein n=1 Tax=Chryseobacterium mulctrae TaxID=2576777 RepID=UPI00111630E6|nr:hypothetical protein [Chryseobacterium mulctrae]